MHSDFCVSTREKRGRVVEFVDGVVYFNGGQMPVECVRAVAFGSKQETTPLFNSLTSFCTLRSESVDLVIQEAQTTALFLIPQDNMGAIGRKLAEVCSDTVVRYCIRDVIGSGFDLRIGGLILNHRGIRSASKLRNFSVGWTMNPVIQDVGPRSTLLGTRHGVSEVVCFDPSRSKQVVLGSFSSGDFNGAYLPTLIALCKDIFGGGRSA